MSTSHHRAELFVLMQLRLLGLGRNPLRRQVDRLEAALRLTTLVASLLVIPTAAVLGTVLGVAADVTLPMVAWPLLFGLFRLARRPLDRHRAEEWAREWEQVAPRWTRPPR